MYVSVLLIHSFFNFDCVWHFALDLL